MKNRSSRWKTACCSVLLLFLWATLARAETTDTAEQAQAAYARGTELVNEGELEAALTQFQRSYELAPHPGLFYPLGQIYQELGRFTEAAEAFQRYLDGVTDESAGPLRADAERRLELVYQRIAGLELELSETVEAEIRVDGELINLHERSAPLPLPPGSHTIVVRAEGHATFERTLQIDAGQRVELAVTLEPLTAPEPALSHPGESNPGAETPAEPATPVSERLPQNETIDSRRRGLRIASWVLLGLGGASLATSLGLGIWNSGRNDDWEAEDRELLEQMAWNQTEEFWEDVRGHNELGESIITAEIGTWIAFGAGLALLATATGLAIAGYGRERGRARLELDDGGLLARLIAGDHEVRP